MSSNGAAHKIITLRCNPDGDPDDEATHFRERLLAIEYDEQGIPIVAHIRCKNRECCPREDGFINLHLFTLYGVQNGKNPGRYVTVKVPTRRLEDMPLGMRMVGGNQARA